MGFLKPDVRHRDPLGRRLSLIPVANKHERGPSAPLIFFDPCYARPLKQRMCISTDRLAFIIHSVDHARAVLTAASDTGRSVALWSALGAAAYLGAPMFRDMINAATVEFPEIDAVGILDCGQDAGFALAALRHGVAFVRVDLPAATKARISDIAEQVGAVILGERPRALDLADCAEPVAACRVWLSAAGDRASPSCQPESPRVVGSSKDLNVRESEE